MSEQKDVVCEQCSTVPTQFVILDCDHPFCLYCISQAFHQDDSGVSCIKCNHPTILDSETIQAIIESKQPQNLKPYTTDKRMHLKPDYFQPNIKGHPFIEKLNIAIERSLDMIRTLQFDKTTIKEKCSKVKQDLESEFIQLHSLLDDKYEQCLNELSQFESHYIGQFLENEESQQIDIEEMTIMKDEVKSMLTRYDGINQDIEQFKLVLNSVDQLVQKKQLTVFQLKEVKTIQEELMNLTKKWGFFYQDYRSFFAQQSQSNDIPQFITEQRLQRIQSTLLTKSILKDRQSPQSYVRLNLQKITTTQQNSSGKALSPFRNTYLNEEINLSRKISKYGHSRIYNSSPLDPQAVLHHSINKIYKNEKTNLLTPFTSYLT